MGGATYEWKKMLMIFLREVDNKVHQWVTIPAIAQSLAPQTLHCVRRLLQLGVMSAMRFSSTAPMAMHIVHR